jgi:hypothetical protein
LTGELNPPCSHWLGNVLEGLRPNVIPADLDLAPHLSIGVVRNANAARLGNAFQPGGDVDAIAKDIVVVYDDIADMDTDPVLNSDLLRDIGILRGHGALDFDRTAGRIDGAGKFHQQAVTGGLDDAAMMGSNSGVNKGFSDRLEPRQSTFLGGTHEAAISGDICSQHRRQSSFYPLACHRCPQCPHHPSEHSAPFVG